MVHDETSITFAVNENDPCFAKFPIFVRVSLLTGTPSLASWAVTQEIPSGFHVKKQENTELATQCTVVPPGFTNHENLLMEEASTQGTNQAFGRHCKHSCSLACARGFNSH